MIEVAAAIIRDELDRILIARRRPGKSQAGLWEFPGGKLEPGESPEDCLRRELREEMSIEIEVGGFFAENEHAYGDTVIRLIAYDAVYVRGDIRLTDHDLVEWVEAGALYQYEFAPADVPFVNRLMPLNQVE